MGAITDTAGLPGLASFAAGYLLVLTVPGPNMLGVGCVAALRGLRGALPMIAGLALGAGMLAGVLLVAMPDPAQVQAVAATGRGIAAAMLLLVAAGILRGTTITTTLPAGGWRASRPAGAAGFLAGFWTAATNPVTAGYFAAACLGPLGGGGMAGASVLAVAMVAGIAFLFWLAVALLLARRRVQGLVSRWQRPIRIVAAAMIAGVAASMIWPPAALAP